MRVMQHGHADALPVHRCGGLTVPCSAAHAVLQQRDPEVHGSPCEERSAQQARLEARPSVFVGEGAA